MENLQREVREETQLSLTSKPKLLAAQDIMLNDERHIVRLTYIAHTTGEPQLDTVENKEYRWVTFEELEAEKDLDVYVKTLLENNLLCKDSWN